ncbi:Protein fam13b [Polyrhizophydium stewartii]|uniref:Protein fam13b n=1 Tax=Polyrhizophydium stewartii TaxID=2732419 RepID=A0ABR4N264_9FUNG
MDMITVTACILKQWMRELTDGIVPKEYFEAFANAKELFVKESMATNNIMQVLLEKYAEIFTSEHILPVPGYSGSPPGDSCSPRVCSPTSFASSRSTPEPSGSVVPSDSQQKIITGLVQESVNVILFGNAAKQPNLHTSIPPSAAPEAVVKVRPADSSLALLRSQITDARTLRNWEAVNSELNAARSQTDGVRSDIEVNGYLQVDFSPTPSHPNMSKDILITNIIEIPTIASASQGSLCCAAITNSDIVATGKRPLDISDHSLAQRYRELKDMIRELQKRPKKLAVKAELAQLKRHYSASKKPGQKSPMAREEKAVMRTLFEWYHQLKATQEAKGRSPSTSEQAEIESGRALIPVMPLEHGNAGHSDAPKALNPASPQNDVDDVRYKTMRQEKKQLQVRLHQYLTEFQKENGRMAQTPEDWAPVRAEYKQYKILRKELEAVERRRSDRRDGE